MSFSGFLVGNFTDINGCKNINPEPEYLPISFFICGNEILKQTVKRPIKHDFIIGKDKDWEVTAEEIAKMFTLNNKLCPISSYKLTGPGGLALSANALKSFTYNTKDNSVIVFNNVDKDLKATIEFTATTIGGVSATKEI